MDALSDTEFKSKIALTDKPVVLKFSGTWCPPCKLYAPLAEAAAASVKDKFHFFEVDIDVCPETAVETNIESIPTTIVFKGGVEVARRTGIVKDLATWLQTVTS